MLLLVSKTLSANPKRCIENKKIAWSRIDLCVCKRLGTPAAAAIKKIGLSVVMGQQASNGCRPF